MERCFTQDQTQKHYQKLQPDILCLLSHFNPETQLKILYLAMYPSFENPNRGMIEDPEELTDPEEIFSSGFINLSLQMVSQFIKNFELEEKSRFGFHSMKIIARLSKETPEITSCAGTGSVILYQDHDSDVLGLLLSNRPSDNRFLNIQRQKVRELKELSLTILTYRYETLKNYDDCWTQGINLFREEIINDRASAARSPDTQEYLQSKRYFLGCEVLSESTNLFDYLRLEKQFPEKRRTIAGYNLAKIAIALTLVVGLVLIACFRDTCEVIRKKASHQKKVEFLDANILEVKDKRGLRVKRSQAFWIKDGSFEGIQDIYDDQLDQSLMGLDLVASQFGGSRFSEEDESIYLRNSVTLTSRLTGDDDSSESL